MTMMADDALVAELSELESAIAAARELADAPRAEALQVEVDRLWDLRRRRQAAADAGRDRDAERPGPADRVEGYLQ